MTVQSAVHLLAGIMILASLALAHFVSPYWYLLTAFVGVNLFQSAFTNWCLAANIFRTFGLKDSQSKSGF
jgi:hypothetical protein